jgi:hypothetical protein
VDAPNQKHPFGSPKYSISLTLLLIKQLNGWLDTRFLATTRRMISSKPIRHKKKLAKLKLKRGRHYKCFWCCTAIEKTAARKAAIECRRANCNSYYFKSAHDNTPNYDDTSSIDYGNVHGPVPVCTNGDHYCQPIFQPSSAPQVYMKQSTTTAATRSSTTKFLLNA